MAVGANRLQIVLLVVRGTFAQVGIGLALGLPISIVVGRVLSARLYNTGMLDSAALTASGVALILGACAASIIPARRAATIDPIRALRME